MLSNTSIFSANSWFQIVVCETRKTKPVHLFKYSNFYQSNCTSLLHINSILYIFIVYFAINPLNSWSQAGFRFYPYFLYFWSSEDRLLVLLQWIHTKFAVVVVKNIWLNWCKSDPEAASWQNNMTDRRLLVLYWNWCIHGIVYWIRFHTFIHYSVPFSSSHFLHFSTLKQGLLTLLLTTSKGLLAHILIVQLLLSSILV